MTAQTADGTRQPLGIVSESREAVLGSALRIVEEARELIPGR
jgi:hypothetical protein